jgi:hypothetical protein
MGAIHSIVDTVTDKFNSVAWFHDGGFGVDFQMWIVGVGYRCLFGYMKDVRAEMIAGEAAGEGCHQTLPIPHADQSQPRVPGSSPARCF